MSKIIKSFEDRNYSVSTGFTKDLGLFSANATIWSYVSETKKKEIIDYKKEIYEHEITDIEISYEINSKHCRRKGFEELYEKLYGIDSFLQFEKDLIKDFEEAYYKLTPYKTK